MSRADFYRHLVLLVTVAVLPACAIDPATRRVYAVSAPRGDLAQPARAPSDVVPLDGEAPAIKTETPWLPEVDEMKLESGLRASIVGSYGIPEVVITAVVEGGLDDAPESVAALAFAAMRLGAPYNGIPLATTLRLYGIRYNATIGSRAMVFQLVAPAKSFAIAMRLLANILWTPHDFPDQQATREVVVRSIHEAAHVPQMLANAQIGHLIEDGEERADDLERGIRNASPRDVARFVARAACPQHTHVVIVGDVKSDDARSAVGRLSGAWQCPSASKYVGRVAIRPLRHVVLVDQPGATQATLEIAGFADGNMPRADVDALHVLTSVLGSTRGRLFRSLREESALSYIAQVQLESHRNFRILKLMGQFENADLVAGIDEVLSTLDTLKKEPTADRELQAATSRSASLVLASLGNTSGWLANHFDANETIEHYKVRTRSAEVTTPDDVRRVAAKVLADDSLQIVIVGDAGVIGPGLQERLGVIDVVKAR